MRGSINERLIELPEAAKSDSGNGQVQVSATIDGQTGTAQRPVRIVSDGMLRVSTTNPLKGIDRMAHLQSAETLTLSAASTAPAGSTYTWTIQNLNSNGVLDPIGTLLTGQNVAYTAPTVANCQIKPRVTFTVTVVDPLGQIGTASLIADVFKNCVPE